MQEKSQFKKLKSLIKDDEQKHDLSYILAQASPQMNHEARIHWLGMLSRWIRSPIQASDALHHSPNVRLRFIKQLLDRHPEWKNRVGIVLAETLRGSRSFSSFAYLGLHEEKGFVDQLAGICLERILPIPATAGDLEECLEHIFPERDDAIWIEGIPAPLIHEIVDLIRIGEMEKGIEAFPGLLRDMLQAMQVVALQIAASGSTPSLWMRIGTPSVDRLPFVTLQEEVALIIARVREGLTAKQLLELPLDGLFAQLKLCEIALRQAFVYLHDHGVNSGMVLRMEYLRDQMRRLALLAEQIQAIQKGKAAEHAVVLLAELVRARYDSHHVTQLLRGNLKMLALRVVEHSGASGEHYITRNRAEYWVMLRSAAGGGVLTVGTTFLKYWIGKIKAPAFIEVFLHTSNYAGSFLLMQSLHFTLATKQPSMTASALARKLSTNQGKGQGTEIAYEMRNIVRSQFAAALGNIGLAVPTAFLVAWGVQSATGHPIFNPDYAHHTIESLNPLKTLAFVYAAETGFFLWLSSLVAGWIENWIAFQQIPERLTRNPRLKRAFGIDAGASLGGFLKRNIGGIAGNVTLGFFLAVVPFLGQISGLPLGISHVTLSSASLTFSVVSMGADLHLKEVLYAVIGVLGIGILNFAVSFSLAMGVARRAQGVGRRLIASARRRVWQLFRTDALSFFVPTSIIEEQDTETRSHH